MKKHHEGAQEPFKLKMSPKTVQRWASGLRSVNLLELTSIE